MSQTRDITSEYRLKRVLKAATLSTVFQAADPHSDQEVAIKLLSPAGAVAGKDKRERFLHAMEAIKSSGLDSFPRLIDVGFTPESSAFMVMELAHGAGLDTLAGQPPARLLPILMQVAVALEDLAKKGVWHHNLSPDNLLVGDDDSVLPRF